MGATGYPIGTPPVAEAGSTTGSMIMWVGLLIPFVVVLGTLAMQKLESRMFPPARDHLDPRT